MNILKISFLSCWFAFSALVLMGGTLSAGETFDFPTVKDLLEAKKFYDDPSPWYQSDKFNCKKILPPEVYAELSYDVEAMQKLWSEIVGFRAPEVVNKTASEIKPGVYSYVDKEKYPGLKALMTETHYSRFKPGAPPFAGNFPEMKIVPTKQYYYALPIAEATKNNMGKTMLDGNTGIIKEETWVSGLPFPRPAGKLKANQVYYNWLKRYLGWDSKYLLSESRGFSKSLKEDNHISSDIWEIRFQGRVMEPYGWFDDKAQERGEERGIGFRFYAPRDVFGNVISSIKYVDADKYDQSMLYVAALRRVRLMSATDVQDSVGGGDAIYLDTDSCSQKISTTVFPSKLEIVAEKELLFPTSHDGSAYLTSPSKGLEYHNLDWERRPVYVIKMTILDKNFVYGHRVIYIDRETFLIRLVENYDQKGRLYRTAETIFSFSFDMGVPNYGDSVLIDHLDLHTSIGRNYYVPAPWIGRSKVNLEYLYKTGK
ncbi:MAG: DUF1329 domain-containing protein [Desulfatitalea sp.]|nr:DUF1329 domain-containing protein [Desulfatitalea sp.]NNK00806.1 DUF1329 domain-containing protein [Desulfatitalea sp.]